jgi:hypothetical protein
MDGVDEIESSGYAFPGPYQTKITATHAYELRSQLPFVAEYPDRSPYSDPQYVIIEEVQVALDTSDSSKEEEDYRDDKDGEERSPTVTSSGRLFLTDTPVRISSKPRSALTMLSTINSAALFLRLASSSIWMPLTIFFIVSSFKFPPVNLDISPLV